MDYSDDYIEDIYGKESFTSYIYFTVYMNQNGDKIDIKKKITCNYSNMDKNEKIVMINLLDKYFKNQYNWLGHNTQNINIIYTKSIKQKK